MTKIGLIVFKNPLGQSVINRSPKPAKQGQHIGALLGEKLANEAFANSREHLRVKGYEL